MSLRPSVLRTAHVPTGSSGSKHCSFPTDTGPRQKGNLRNFKRKQIKQKHSSLPALKRSRTGWRSSKRPQLARSKTKEGTLRERICMLHYLDGGGCLGHLRSQEMLLCVMLDEAAEGSLFPLPHQASQWKVLCNQAATWGVCM